MFCQSSYQLTTSTIITADIFLFHHSWITSLKAKIRDYPSGLEPDLKSRKAFIYLSYYTLTYPPLTSILPSQRVSSVETYLLAELIQWYTRSLGKSLSLVQVSQDYSSHIQFALARF